MRTFKINIFQGIRFKRLIALSAIISCAVGLFSVAFIAFLPSIISTSYSQKHMQRLISAKLKRSVSWVKLVASWSDGLAIKDLSVGHGQAPLLKAGIADVVFNPEISYMHGR